MLAGFKGATARLAYRANDIGRWRRGPIQRSDGTRHIPDSPSRTAGAMLPESERGAMLAAVGGIGLVGVLVVVLIVLAIIYFVRRA
jgi:hypothetical protein